MSKDKTKKPKLFLMTDEQPDISSEKDSSEVTTKDAARILARTLQNIYLDVISQDREGHGNSHDDLQKSFELREYAEMSLLKNLDDDTLLGVYNYVIESEDWNEAVEPLSWGYITFQRDPRISFLLFLTTMLQSLIIKSRGL